MGSPHSLSALREQLDSIDNEIVRLLRRRSEVVLEVGEVKRATGLPFYAPDRERQILDRISDPEVLGAFPPDAARLIFREIIAACRALETPMRIAYLGPAGTFTESAALGYFGHAGELLPQPDITTVFNAVTQQHADYGLVPVENSTAGTIREVLDLLAEARLTIVGEAYYDVHHCLVSRAETLAAIRVVLSKDSALDQCKQWLKTNLPQAELVAVPSTADGARTAAADPHAAAIAPEQAAKLYEIPILARNIEDRQDNRTRFFALGHDGPGPSGRDKTSLLLAVAHKPGALVQALEVIQRHGLNMTLIESRPSPYKVFEYLFYIDVEGHRQDAIVAAALEELKTVCVLIQVLGSYPRAG